MIKCPFCGEDDFDKVGLKFHLENYCEEYKSIDTPAAMFTEKRYVTCQRSIMTRRQCFDCMVYKFCDSPIKETFKTKENEADKDIKENRVHVSKTADEVIKYLKDK